MLIRKYTNEIINYEEQLNSIDRDQVTLVLKQTVFELGYFPGIWDGIVIPDGLSPIPDKVVSCA